MQREPLFSLQQERLCKCNKGGKQKRLREQQQKEEREGKRKKGCARPRTLRNGGKKEWKKGDKERGGHGEDKSSCFSLTHIEQRLQHQSAIAPPSSPRDPLISNAAANTVWAYAALLFGNNPTSATPCQHCNDITSEALASPVFKAVLADKAN